MRCFRDRNRPPTAATTVHPGVACGCAGFDRAAGRPRGKCAARKNAASVVAGGLGCRRCSRVGANQTGLAPESSTWRSCPKLPDPVLPELAAAGNRTASAGGAAPSCCRPRNSSNRHSRRRCPICPKTRRQWRHLTRCSPWSSARPSTPRSASRAVRASCRAKYKPTLASCRWKTAGGSAFRTGTATAKGIRRR